MEHVLRTWSGEMEHVLRTWSGEMEHVLRTWSGEMSKHNKQVAPAQAHKIAPRSTNDVSSLSVNITKKPSRLVNFLTPFLL